MFLLDPIALIGRYVRLEPLCLDHVEPLVAAASGSRETYTLTLVPSEPVSMRRYIETALVQHRDGTALPFAILDAASLRVVGSTRFGSLEYWQWPNESTRKKPPNVPDAVEIGWTWLAREAQRTAINTEAKLLMLTHAFETWCVHRVILKTDVRNHRSRTAIERLGAKLDGLLRANMPAYDGGIRDTALYSLLATEWPEVKARLEARLNPST